MNEINNDEFLNKRGLLTLLSIIKEHWAKIVRRGQPNGVAELDENQLIPLDRIPKTALDNLVKVENNEQRLLLTKNDVQNGDSVLVLDDGSDEHLESLYLVVDDTQLDSENGYVFYHSSVTWSTVMHKPENFVFYGDQDSEVVDIPLGTDYVTESMLEQAITNILDEKLQNLYKLIGTTDISGFGDGTITGILDELNAETPILIQSKNQ